MEGIGAVSVISSLQANIQVPLKLLLSWSRRGLSFFTNSALQWLPGNSKIGREAPSDDGRASDVRTNAVLADVQALRRYSGQALEPGFGKVVALKQFHTLVNKPRHFGNLLYTFGQQVDMQVLADHDNGACNWMPVTSCLSSLMKSG